MVIVVRKRSLILLVLLIIPLNVFAAKNPYEEVPRFKNTYTSAVWDLVYENTGIALPYWDEPSTWESKAKLAGYTVGTKPRSNSIVINKSGCKGVISSVEYINRILTYDEWYNELTTEGLNDIYDSMNGGDPLSKEEIFSNLIIREDFTDVDYCMYVYDKDDTTLGLDYVPQGMNPKPCPNFDYDNYFYTSEYTGQLIKYDNSASGCKRVAFIYLDIPPKPTTTTKKKTTTSTTTTKKKTTTIKKTSTTTKKITTTLKNTTTSSLMTSVSTPTTTETTSEVEEDTTLVIPTLEVTTYITSTEPITTISAERTIVTTKEIVINDSPETDKKDYLLYILIGILFLIMAYIYISLVIKK